MNTSTCHHRLKRYSALLFAAGLLAFAHTARADALVTYSFTGTPKTNATSFADHLEPGAWTASSAFGSGAGVSALGSVYFVRGNVTADTYDDALSSQSYLSFDVAIDDTYSVSLDSLTFKIAATTDGSPIPALTTNCLLAALDPVSNEWVYFPTITDDPATVTVTGNSSTATWTAVTGDLSGNPDFQSVTGTLSVRLYIWDDADLSSQYTRFENVTLNGTVSQIPEPATFALALGMTAMLVALRVRRK